MCSTVQNAIVLVPVWFVIHPFIYIMELVLVLMEKHNTMEHAIFVILKLVKLVLLIISAAKDNVRQLFIIMKEGYVLVAMD